MEGNITESVRGNEILFNVLDAGMKHISSVTLPPYGTLFLCLTSGVLRVTDGGGERTLTDGDCFVCGTDKSHIFSYDTSENARTAYAVCGGEMVRMLTEFYGIKLETVIRSPDSAEAVTHICKLYGDPDIDEREKLEECAVAFHMLVHKLCRASRLYGKNKENTAARIKAYIDQHPEGKLTLDELSGLFFVSKTQIFRIFKEAYGVAPMQYYLSRKTELAKQLLTKTELRISEIAEALSFTDAKHFSKTFRKFSGELPRNYRREAKISTGKENRKKTEK